MECSVRLSQAMIVKNEERNIRRALEWAKDLAAEQIVVDTGSTDRTVAIAAELGARVLQFPWEDDFSAAKNFAIAQCEGDWIALLDADEYFAPEEAEKLPQALEQASEMGMDAILCAWMQVSDEGAIGAGGSTIRLFRNTPELRYHRRVHEQLEFSDKRMLKAVDFSADLAILHTGYGLEEAGRKLKDERNLRLIQQELLEHPGDHEMLGYLGDERLAREQWEGAAECYQEAIAHFPEDLSPFLSRSSMTFVNLMTALTMLDDGEELWQTYLLGSRLLPTEPDIPYLMGSFCFQRAEYKDAAQYLGEAIQKLSGYGTALQGAAISGNLAHACAMYAHSLLHVGRKQEAVDYAVEVLKTEKKNTLALDTLLSCFLAAPGAEGQDMSAAALSGKLDFLKNFYDFSNEADKDFVLQSALRAGDKALARHLHHAAEA